MDWTKLHLGGFGLTTPTSYIEQTKKKEQAEVNRVFQLQIDLNLEGRRKVPSPGGMTLPIHLMQSLPNTRYVYPLFAVCRSRPPPYPSIQDF